MIKISLAIMITVAGKCGKADTLHSCVMRQECIGDRMCLAGVVMQLDWQAALEGSQMMQQPQEFARIAEEGVAKNMDRIRLEAATRGWLSHDLPSGIQSWPHTAHMLEG